MGEFLVCGFWFEFLLHTFSSKAGDKNSNQNQKLETRNQKQFRKTRNIPHYAHR